MDPHEQQRIKNKVEDIEKFYIPIIKELYKAISKAKRIDWKAPRNTRMV